MKKLAIILTLLLPLAAAAQTEVGGGARLSAAFDYKINKGFHAYLEEEIRVNGVFQSLNRFQTTVGVTYKPVKFLKLGAGYSLINPYDKIERYYKPPRHRFFLEAAAHVTVNYFSFSIKETFRFTHRSGSFNPYQNTRNAMALKSRIGLEYKGWSYFEPGVFVEMRTQLNAPWGEISGTLQTKDDGITYYNYTPKGYTHVYNDRFRIIFRTDIRLNRHNYLKPYAFIDFYSPYEIDTNAEGTRLFRATYANYLDVIIGISYTFKF